MFRAIAIEDERPNEWGELSLKTGEFLGFFETPEEAQEYSQENFHEVTLRFEEVPYSLIKGIDRIFHRVQEQGFFEKHPEVMEKLYMAKSLHEAELLIARTNKTKA